MLDRGEDGGREDEEVLKEVWMPKGHMLVTPIIFGYSAKGAPKAPARNEDVILNWMR